MKVFIIQTKNVMTTAYYYELLASSLENICDRIIMCKGLTGLKADKINDIIVSGNPIITFKAGLIGYKRIITWYQGAGPEERAMQGCWKMKVFLHRFLEQFSLNHSFFHILVSRSLKHHFENKYHINIPDENCLICPCFNDAEIYDECFKKDVKKPYSFIYSGGLGVWQCFEKTLKVFKKIKGSIPEATLSIFTYSVDEAKQIVANLGMGDVDVRYVDKKDLNRELMPYMFGFVLREDSVVNRVATPTKLSNYTANGIIPICSTVVEDFTAQTQNYKYVIHINEENENEIAERIIGELKNNVFINYNYIEHREECIRLFSHYYSPKKYKEELEYKVKALI